MFVLLCDLKSVTSPPRFCSFVDRGTLAETVLEVSVSSYPAHLDETSFRDRLCRAICLGLANRCFSWCVFAVGMNARQRAGTWGLGACA